MVSSRKWIWGFSIAGFALAMFPSSLFAGTEITFAGADLRAFYQLAKPEQTSLQLDGLTGRFQPSPSLQFAGLEAQDFDIDLNLGADLVDLRFNNLRAKAPAVIFDGERIRVDIAFEDQSKAIKSALGAISLKEVKLSAWARFAADGSPRISYDAGAISGEMKGSGLLKPRWVIDALKKIALKVLKAQLERQLARASVQDSIEKGLVVWSRFSADPRLSRVTPGTIKVSADAIRFESE